MRNFWLTAIIVCLLLPFFFIPANAVETSAVSPINELIPPKFAFSTSSTCAGHDCFFQASAEADGSFLVVSRYTKAKGNQEKVFRLCFVDIYTPEGKLETELSFYTEQDFVAEKKQSTVYLYFCDRIITFDLDTGALDAVQIEYGLPQSNGTFTRLRLATFQSGEWQYACQKSFHGYTKLTRTNGQHTETLVSCPGTGYSVWNTLVPAVMLGLSLFFLFRWLKKRCYIRCFKKSDD